MRWKLCNGRNKSIGSLVWSHLQHICFASTHPMMRCAAGITYWLWSFPRKLIYYNKRFKCSQNILLKKTQKNPHALMHWIILIWVIMSRLTIQENNYWLIVKSTWFHGYVVYMIVPWTSTFRKLYLYIKNPSIWL